MKPSKDEIGLAQEIYCRSLDDRLPDPDKFMFEEGAKSLARRSLFLARAFFEAAASAPDGMAKKKRLTLSVSSAREEGLDARWGKSRGGGRCLQVRDPAAEDPKLSLRWHDVDTAFRKKLVKHCSWREAFNEYASGLYRGGQSAPLE